MIAVEDVEPEATGSYGIVATDAFDGRQGRIRRIVEKPKPADAPSNLAVVGRYVLPPEIFDAIRRIGPGAGGEIQLTDAMAILLAEGVPVHGIVYRGTRYDTGLPLGYLQAVVQVAARRADLGPAFRNWLTDYVKNELTTTD